jgi:hypothetical protein
MAIMRAGQLMELVCESLRLYQGQFHFIWRSNAQSDIQILFCTMVSGMGGVGFFSFRIDGGVVQVGECGGMDAGDDYST